MTEKVKDIVDIIRGENLNDAEIRELYNNVYDMVKDTRDANGADVKKTLGVGDRVTCSDGKTGAYGVGTIIKKNPKKAKVKFDCRPDSETWNIPYNMLRKVQPVAKTI